MKNHLRVGRIEFNLKPFDDHFSAIRSRIIDVLIFEDLYYKLEYENEKLREEILKLKKRNNRRRKHEED